MSPDLRVGQEGSRSEPTQHAGSWGFLYTSFSFSKELLSLLPPHLQRTPEKSKDHMGIEFVQIVSLVG